MTIEEKFREHLKYYKLKEVAELAGMNPDWLSLFKVGRIKSMSLSKYQKIKDALDQIHKKTEEL